MQAGAYIGKDLVKMSDSPETALAIVFRSFLCTPHSWGRLGGTPGLDLGHITSSRSLANGRVCPDKISKALWTPPPFLLVTHVLTRCILRPGGLWGADTQHAWLRATPPPQGCVWRICNATTYRVLVWVLPRAGLCLRMSDGFGI